MKKITYNSIEIEIDGKNIKDVIKILEQYKDYQGAYININNYLNYDVAECLINIEYKTLETDEEEKEREKYEKQIRENREEQMKKEEIKEYERLRKKYG